MNEPATHAHTYTPSPLDLGFPAILSGPTARSLIYGHAGPEINEKARRAYMQERCSQTYQHSNPGQSVCVLPTLLPSLYLLSHLVVLSARATQGIRPPITLTPAKRKLRLTRTARD